MADNTAELVSKSQAGDIAAFEELIAKYQSKIYNIAYRLSGNPHDASDLAQEALIKIYRSIGSFRGEAAFSTWAYHIMTNVYRDHLRKKSRRAEDFLDNPIDTGESEMTREVADSTYDPEILYENSELGQYLQSLINGMHDEYKIVIILREQMGYSYEEIAQQLDLPLGTVKSRINRARQYLQKKIKEDREQYPKIHCLIGERK